MPIRCEDCGEPVTRVARGRRRLARRRHRPVLDARLAEPGVDRRGLRDRRRQRADAGPTCPTTPTGRSGSRPTGSREMREQIRLWFYSQLFMSVVLVGRSPYKRVLGYEKMLDEHGREMHGSWGNMIDAEDAFARMGADVMRWQYCAQPPDRNLLFGFGPAHEIKRKLLTLWNSVGVPRRLREHRGLRAGARRPRDGPAGRAAARPLARRAHARARPRGRGGVRGDADRGRDPRVRGVRRRPLELVHPPLAPAF